jgi:hypothetical protein
MSQIACLNQVPLMYEDSFPSLFPLIVGSSSSQTTETTTTTTFDSITTSNAFDLYTSLNYQKGLALLMMCESIIGESAFQNSLRVTQISISFA